MESVKNDHNTEAAKGIYIVLNVSKQYPCAFSRIQYNFHVCVSCQRSRLACIFLVYIHLATRDNTNFGPIFSLLRRDLHFINIVSQDLSGTVTNLAFPYLQTGTLQVAVSWAIPRRISWTVGGRGNV